MVSTLHAPWYISPANVSSDFQNILSAERLWSSHSALPTVLLLKHIKRFSKLRKNETAAALSFETQQQTVQHHQLPVEGACVQLAHDAVGGAVKTVVSISTARLVVNNATKTIGSQEHHQTGKEMTGR